MQRIKLMADYGCFPVWYDGQEPDKLGDIDPATLPISPALIADLQTWSAWLDETLDWNDPGNTLWPDNFWKTYNAEGGKLADRLRQELGSAFEVRAHFWGQDAT